MKSRKSEFSNTTLKTKHQNMKNKLFGINIQAEVKSMGKQPVHAAIILHQVGKYHCGGNAAFVEELN